MGLCPRHRRNRTQAIALGWLTALAIGQSIGNIVFALLTTTALAWLYRRYADALAAPA